MQKRGFTLIELLVVIAVIGILASVILASLNSARAKARDTRRMEDLRQIVLALELYYDSNGFYPQTDCGWDCNGYRYSDNATSWAALALDLAPYISKLSTDPLNTGGAPWAVGGYTYTYGNVGRYSQRVQYDLTAQFESSTNAYRCAVRQYTFYFDRQAWCGPYTGQVYEASPN